MDAVRALARFHAKYRNRVASADETKDWVLLQDDEAYYNLVRDAYCKAVPTLDDERWEFVGIDPDTVPNFKALMQYILESYEDKYLPMFLNDFKRKNPHSQFSNTLIHGDFRAENMFFPKQAGGEVTVVDYQLLKESLPAEDLSYFIVTSMNTEDRRKSEAQMLQLYYEETRRCGATDLTMEELLLTYQTATLTQLLISVIGQKDTNAEGSEKGKLLMKSMFERVELALEDWNTLEAVKLRFSKLDSNSVASKYTREELLLSIPQQFHALLS